MQSSRPKTPPFPIDDVADGRTGYEPLIARNDSPSTTSVVRTPAHEDEVIITTYQLPASQFNGRNTRNDSDELLDGVAKCDEDEVDSPAMTRKSNPCETKSSTSSATLRPSTLIIRNKGSRISEFLEDNTSSSDEDTGRGLAKTITRPTPMREMPMQYQPTQLQDPIRTTYQSQASVRQSSEPPLNDDTISVRDLSAILTPDVLFEVKTKLRKSSRHGVTRQMSSFATTAMPGASFLSPAAEWEKKRPKVKLNKQHASSIKAGWRVRQLLAHLGEDETKETLLHRLVREGMERETRALFAIGKTDPRFKFDCNCRNEHNKSVLRIANDLRNTSMIKTLLKHNVKLGDCLFHAIKQNYIDGARAILEHNSSRNAKIVGENYYFQPGMTPMILAATNNNYRLVNILHDYGHRLQELRDWIEGIHTAWESSNERRMLCGARSSPAYITLLQEKNHIDPFEYCLNEIQRLNSYRNLEHEFGEYYQDIVCKLENFMCALLDQIQSSAELAALFRYDYVPLQDVPTSKLPLMDRNLARQKIGNRLKLLEDASQQRLVAFVTHQQSQLALSYLRYRSVPFIREQSPFVRNIITILLGMMFPILSLIYVTFPKTKAGSLLNLPIISFSCHMISDICFVILLLVNILIKQTGDQYLGAPPTPIQIIIAIWILGKWVQEAQECINRGPKDYFSDYWNYNDIIQLTLFTISIIFRIMDIMRHYGSDAHAHHMTRSQWSAYEPRLLAEALQAFAYVFVFMRLLGIARADRTLGPLQISLARMLVDVVRFLCIFSLVIFAFAFGLSELYWYYGTEEGVEMFCKNNTIDANGTTAPCDSSVHTVFTTPWNAAIDLFWALFGYIELTDLKLGGRHIFTEYVGVSLTAIYHVVAIIVMLNMLIAMMSKSYETTSANEETEWKFHRTSMWIRYIRREVIRPPPMNLFPNPYRLKENFRRFKNFIIRAYKCCNKPYRRYGTNVFSPSRKQRTSYSSSDSYLSGYNTSDEENLVDGLCCGRDKKKKALKHNPPLARTTSRNSVANSPVDKLIIQSVPGSAINSNEHIEMKAIHQHGKKLTDKARKKIKAVIRIDVASQAHKTLLSKFVTRYKFKHLIDAH